MPTVRPDALAFFRVTVRGLSEHLSFIAMRRIIFCHRKLCGSAPPEAVGCLCFPAPRLLPSSIQAAADPIPVEGGVEQPDVNSSFGVPGDCI